MKAGCGWKFDDIVGWSNRMKSETGCVAVMLGGGVACWVEPSIWGGPLNATRGKLKLSLYWTTHWGKWMQNVLSNSSWIVNLIKLFRGTYLYKSDTYLVKEFKFLALATRTKPKCA